MMDVFVVEAKVKGRLAVALRPRGGDWLEDDLLGLKQAGFGVLVSMLTSDEERELDLVSEEGLAARVGLRFLRLATTDRAPPRVTEAAVLARDLAAIAAGGGSVAVHCRQGIGRSASIIAATLVALGNDPSAAWTLVAVARGRPVPDTEEQRQWLDELQAVLAANKERAQGSR